MIKTSNKEIVEELVKEILDEIIELTNEANFNDLIYHFMGDTASKKFDGFKNRIKLFEKLKSGDMKLEEAKKMQNVFKSNLNEISKGRYKSEEQKSALQNLKLLKLQEAVIKLFNYYSSIAFEAKQKTIQGKAHPSDLILCLKLLTPKQMLQRLSIALS